MTDKERKEKIQELIAKWTPLAAHGVKLSLGFPKYGSLVISHKKPIIGTTTEFIDGLLIGAGLAPSYYGDYGPCGGSVPWIEWKGPRTCKLAAHFDLIGL